MNSTPLATLFVVLLSVVAKPVVGVQESLPMTINAGERVLTFDWPIVQIGTGEYRDGPTGVTVFHFKRRVQGVVDVRGGSPGTVNTDYLRQGYDMPDVDAVVLSGGSAYGLESVPAVGTALKDDGLSDGSADNIAFAVGAIIYDLGGRRLNEIYPDKRLAQAALRAARPGIFPLGAQGAGSMAITGGLFGCNAFSGQGGAFRQVADLKIAAFVVVNALGLVTTRDGHVAACYPAPGWPQELKTTDLLSQYPVTRNPLGRRPPPQGNQHNTTISLLVINQKLPAALLQRIAVQVHASMARAIQPFATQFDGDVLYAMSTAEIDTANRFSSVDIGTIASEVMWDAILASVPQQPSASARTSSAWAPRPADLHRLIGDYVFSRFVRVTITADGVQLFAQATGERDAFAITRGERLALQPLAPMNYSVPGRYPLTLLFYGKSHLVLNPGQWQQTGSR